MFTRLFSQIELFVVDPDIAMNYDMSGEVADPSNLPVGCSFNPRCQQCLDSCTDKAPQLIECEPEHFVACHLYGKNRTIFEIEA